MQFPSAVSVAWVAKLIGANTIVGDENALATGINEINRVQKGDLVFVDHPKYYEKCIGSDASFIIINKAVDCPPGKALLVVDEPFEAYLKIVQHFRPFVPYTKSISDSASIGEGSVVMPNVFIGHEVRIGKNCVIQPNITILDYCVIGDNVVIQSGTTIGSDAFYYNKKTNRDIHYKKMLSCGRVVIEDGVEIGANCTIDRGVTHDTLIGRGSKLDNLIHIGHDTIVGKNCLFAAQVGIAGATTIEDNVILWGQVGVSKTLTIGENAIVLAQSGVPSSLAANKTYFGYPAEDASTKRRELVWIKRIPEMWEKLKNKE
jgi:UDP-3-O-[3-hydroxymyristoyl] glucosamine N-acyltransferase